MSQQLSITSKDTKQMDLKMRTVIAAVAIIFNISFAAGQDKPTERKFTREQIEGLLKKGGLTADDTQALRKQIMACWTPQKPTVEVVIRVKYKMDGTVDGVPSLVDRKDQAEYLEAASAAITAVTKCQPIKLPASSYDSWKTIELVLRGE